MKLNIVEKLIEWVRSLFDPKVPRNTIDTSGIVYSDYPNPGNGYFKGWVSSRNHVVVAGHSLISPGHKVYVWDRQGNKIERTVTAVERPLIRTTPGYTPSFQDQFIGGDVSVCRVNAPWPDGVTSYLMANSFKKKQLAISFHKDRTFSFRRLQPMNGSAWIVGKFIQRALVPGDSGLPWFVFEDGQFKVVSHTTRVKYGEGPDYTALVVRKAIKNAMVNLGAATPT